MFAQGGPLAVLSDIAPAYRKLYLTLWQQDHVPPQVLELCRMRLMQLHGGAVPDSAVLFAEKQQRLRHWHSDDAFTEAERACIAFTEVYVMDAQGITDALAEDVKRHYGDSGLVLLIEALGILDGAVRISRLWNLDANWMGVSS